MYLCEVIPIYFGYMRLLEEIMLLRSNANITRKQKRSSKCVAAVSPIKRGGTHDPVNIRNVNLSEFWFVHDLEPSFNKKNDISNIILRYVQTPEVQLCQFFKRGTMESIIIMPPPCLCVG